MKWLVQVWNEWEEKWKTIEEHTSLENAMVFFSDIQIPVRIYEVGKGVIVEK